MKAKERHKYYTRRPCPLLVQLEYVNVWFSSFVEHSIEKQIVTFPDAVPFILIFVSPHHNLTAWVLEHHQAITFLLYNTRAVIFSVTNLPPFPIFRSIYFFPSLWPPLPAITDCFSHHLFSLPPHSSPLIPSPCGNCFYTIRKIYDWTQYRSYYSYSFWPSLLAQSPTSSCRSLLPDLFLPPLPIFTTHPRLALFASPFFYPSNPQKHHMLWQRQKK